ncbi:hypothetical protein [Parapedobacter koreensis]|uniref:Erythromycin esterase homolog n=1 Tax=Parapedobacter koreensis TaxID=332977 RepID=A0A1H7P5U7_9SPHI|nr:hypothetical protein [Parapedobacter koreensis]SEL30625.1 hypothetical protein SAMN05421740_104209 [Parapedobacter koreensis]
MKKYSILLIGIFFFNLSFGQDTLSSGLVRAHSRSFVISDNNITGNGWTLIQDAFRSSQFVLLGESHFSPLISQLTKAILDFMPEDGFNHFMIETGPVAVLQLMSLYNANSAQFQSNLFNFLSEYKLTNGFPPSEFINMKADVDMYKKAIERNIKIVGLDREYYSSIEYLFDRLASLTHNDRDKKLSQYAKEALLRHKSAYINDGSYAFMTEVSNDQNIKEYLSVMVETGNEANFIIQELSKTFKVYTMYEAKKYFDSEEVRLANIKSNFGISYNSYFLKEKKPMKAFIKIGNVHSGRGLSPLGHYDIGNTVAELSMMNGNASTHIYAMRRYRYGDNGEVQDFIKNGFEKYEDFIGLSDKEKWIVVDLRPLREAMESRKLVVPVMEERNLIKNHDLLLLLPVDGAYSESLNYQ